MCVNVFDCIYVCGCTGAIVYMCVRFVSKCVLMFWIMETFR